ncbi:ABC transporter sulfonates-family ATP-binding protein [Clostridioides difficile]|nr:ABC transporter sulfonates-family ATP-binding protein [Clostridioides difficile]
MIVSNFVKSKSISTICPTPGRFGIYPNISIKVSFFNPIFTRYTFGRLTLDYFTRRKMQKEVVNIHKNTKKGVVFVTHNIEEAMEIAKKIIVFSKNKRIKQFSVEDEYNRDLTKNYYINLKKEILRELGEF